MKEVQSEMNKLKLREEELKKSNSNLSNAPQQQQALVQLKEEKVEEDLPTYEDSLSNFGVENKTDQPPPNYQDHKEDEQEEDDDDDDDDDDDEEEEEEALENVKKQDKTQKVEHLSTSLDTQSHPKDVQELPVIETVPTLVKLESTKDGLVSIEGEISNDPLNKPPKPRDNNSPQLNFQKPKLGENEELPVLETAPTVVKLDGPETKQQQQPQPTAKVPPVYQQQHYPPQPIYQQGYPNHGYYYAPPPLQQAPQKHVTIIHELNGDITKKTSVNGVVVVEKNKRQQKKKRNKKKKQKKLINPTKRH